MVMEYVSGGELFDYICKHGRVSHFICLVHLQLSLSSFYPHVFTHMELKLKMNEQLWCYDGLAV